MKFNTIVNIQKLHILGEKNKWIYESRVIYLEFSKNISIPPRQAQRESAEMQMKESLFQQKKVLYEQLQKTTSLEERKDVLSKIQEVNQQEPNVLKYTNTPYSDVPDFEGSKAKKDIYMKSLLEKLLVQPNPIVLHSPIELEAILQMTSPGQRPEGFHIQLGKEFHNSSLHLNPGIVKDINNIDFNGSPEFNKKLFTPPLLIEGSSEVILKELNLFHVDGVQLKNITFQKQPEDLKPPNKYGIREDRLVRMNDVNNITLDNCTFHGNPLDIEGLKQGNIEGVAGAHKGLLVQGGNNINIQNSHFDNLYHAMELVDISGGSVSGNHADMIVSDMITGGGIRGNDGNNPFRITQNISGLRLPIILGKNENGDVNKVHSDFIQLYTEQSMNTDWNMKNENVLIDGNIENNPEDNPIYQQLLASEEAKKYLVGVQGILIGDEKNIGNKNITIQNNTIYCNQNNAITITDSTENLENIKKTNRIYIYKNPNIGDIHEKKSLPKIRKMDPKTKKPIEEISI